MDIKLSFFQKKLIYIWYKGIAAFHTKVCTVSSQSCVLITVGPGIRFGRISGLITDIEIIRPDIQYCWIFSLTLLKLSGGYPTIWSFISNKLDIIRPDSRPNRISDSTLVQTITSTSCQAWCHIYNNQLRSGWIPL